MDYPATETQRLTDHHLMLAHDMSSVGGTGRPLNSYVVETKAGLVLFDCGLEGQGDAVEAIRDGRPVIALVVSHSDVVSHQTHLGALAERFGAPMLLHADDHADSRVREAGLALEDAMGHAALRGTGLRVVPVPGHTPGSIMLYDPFDGGVLLAGDSAVTAGPEQADDPDLIERPKMGEVEERTFAAAWRPVMALAEIGSLLPLHGRPMLGRDDLRGRLSEMLERPPMDPSGG